MENLPKKQSFKIDYIEEYSDSNEIKNKGYTFIDSNTFQKIQKNCIFYDVQEQDVKAFISSWDDLDLDLFLSDKSKYCTRKHVTFTMKNEHKVDHSLTEIQINDTRKTDVSLRDVLVITCKKA